MDNTVFRIACYSEPKLLAKYNKKKLSGALIKQAIKDNYMFDLQCAVSGHYTDVYYIRDRGTKQISVRYNQDRDVVIIKL